MRITGFARNSLYPVLFFPAAERCSLCFEWKNAVPIILHADDRPAFGLRFVECLIKTAEPSLAVVCPLAHGVGMMDNEGEARATPGGRPLEHLQIAVGVPEGGNGAAADECLDTDGFPSLVVKEMEFRQLYQRGRSITQLEFQFAGTADDLFGWDAIRLLRKGPHEFDTATGNNEGLEAVRAQVGE